MSVFQSREPVYDGPCIGGPMDGKHYVHLSPTVEVIYFNGFEKGAREETYVPRVATVSKYYYWHDDKKAWVFEVLPTYKTDG